MRHVLAGAIFGASRPRSVAPRRERPATRLVWISTLLLTLAISPCVVKSESPTAGRGVFEDRTEASGVDFVHFTGVSGEFYIVEISGPGCGLLDYDNDGWVDILLTNFGHNQLWRNKGDGSFEEVIGVPASSRHAGAAKRELQCSLPRRVPECPLVSDARGCSAPDRDLAPRLQPRPASQFPRGAMRKVYRQEEGSNHVR